MFMGRKASMCALMLGCMVVSAFAGGDVIEIRDRGQWERLLQKETLIGRPVVVDFFSNGCGPCRMIAPVYEQIATQYKGKAIFVKVNVQTTNIGIDIRSMPTFQFYLKGKKQHEFSGADEGGIRRTTQMLVKKASKAKKVKDIATFKDFKKTLSMAAKMPVVVAFVSKTSEDCKKIYPTFKTLASDYLGKALFVKVNVDDNAETATHCKVEGPDNTPTFQFFIRGKMKEEVTGADERTLTDTCTDLIGDAEDEDESGGGGDGEKKCEPKKKKRRLPRARRASRTTTEKVIILGAGPAGLSAAIYAARAGLNPIVLAPKVGGQLMSTKEVENYPGMIESEGTWIVEAMREQAQLYGTGYEEDWATSVDLTKYPFEIATNSSTFTTRTLIVATGADSRWLGIPGEEKYKTLGVSSCATCDGFLYKNRNVVVIGGGDTAMEDSLVLARICKSVKLLHRRDSFRASKILQDRVLTNKKIEVMWNTVAEEFTGTDGKLTGCKIKNSKTGEQSELKVDGGFVAIGHDPNTALFKDQLAMGDDGYLHTFNHSTYTSIAGVFAAGDVADHVYRQAVTSAGTGSMSALDAERWISANGWDKVEVPNVPLLPEDFPKWRVKKLKEAMAERLLSSKGCVEKKDFVKKLTKWQKKKTKALAKAAAASASVEVGAGGEQATNYDQMSLDQIHVAMQGKGLNTECTVKVDCIASLKAAQ